MLTFSNDRQVSGAGLLDWGLVEGLLEEFMAFGNGV